MDRKPDVEQLKLRLAEEGTPQSAAVEDQVVAETKIGFDPQTRQFVMDVILTAKPGFEIANYATSLGYRDPGGKGQPGTYHGGRSWGVAEGPVIRTGIDITVTTAGKHQGSWAVGTFVKTGGGYDFWIKRGTVEIG
jgi:hypothetical protein